MILSAQAVPSSAMLPCVAALPAGWSIGGATISSGKVSLRLDSDRAGPRAITVTLAAACDTSGARQIPSDQPGTRRFERPLNLVPQFSDLRFYTFPGGCVTYQFSFAAGASPVLAGTADPAMSDDAIAHLASGLLFAGHGSTVAVIDRGILLLLTHAGEREALRRNPARSFPYTIGNTALLPARRVRRRGGLGSSSRLLPLTGGTRMRRSLARRSILPTFALFLALVPAAHAAEGNASAQEEALIKHGLELREKNDDEGALAGSRADERQKLYSWICRLDPLQAMNMSR